VDPLSTVALESSVSVACHGYHSPIGAEPLTYSFRVLDSVRGPSVEQQLALEENLPSAALVGVRLPADVFAVRIYITDTAGVSTSADAYVAVAPPTDFLSRGGTCYARGVVDSPAFLSLQRAQDHQALFMHVMQLARYLNEASSSFGESEPLPCAVAASPEAVRTQVRLELFTVLLQVAAQNFSSVPAARLLWQSVAALTGDLTSLSSVFDSAPTLRGQVVSMLLSSVTSLRPTTYDLQMAASAPTSPWTPLVDSVANLLAVMPCSEFSRLHSVLDGLLVRLSTANSQISEADANIVRTSVLGSSGTLEVSVTRGSVSDGAHSDGSLLDVTVPASTVASAINKGVPSTPSSLDTEIGLSLFAQYHLRASAFARDIVGRCFPVPSSPATSSFPLWAYGGPLSAISTSVDADVTRRMDAAAVAISRVSRVSRVAIALPSSTTRVFAFNVLLDPSVSLAASMPVSALECSGGHVQLHPDAPTVERSTKPQGLKCAQWNTNNDAWSTDSCTTGSLLADYTALQCECIAPASGSLNSLVPVVVAPELFGALFRLPILPNGSCDAFAPGWNLTDDHLLAPLDPNNNNNSTLTSGVVDLIEANDLWFYLFTACLYGLVAFGACCEFIRYAGGMNRGHPFRRWLLLSTFLLICGVSLYRVVLMCLLYSSVLSTYLSLSFSVSFPQVLTVWCFVLACMSMSRAARKLQRNVLTLEAEKQYNDDMAAAELIEDERRAAATMHQLRVAYAMRQLQAKKLTYLEKTFDYLRASWIIRAHVKFAVALAVLSILILCALLWATGLADADQGDLMMRGAQICEGLLALLAMAFYVLHTRIEWAAVRATAGSALTKHHLEAAAAAATSGGATHPSALSKTAVAATSPSPVMAAASRYEARLPSVDAIGESEMNQQEESLSRASFEQAEEFAFTGAFVRSSVFLSLPTFCLLVSSLLLLYCGAVGHPGVGFVGAPFVNYVYLLFDVATLLLVMFWLHQTVPLSADEDEQQGRYRSKYAMQQDQAILYATQAENVVGRSKALLARQGSQAWSLERQSTAGYIDTSQLFRQGSMRFGSPQHRSTGSWAGMGQATSTDGTLILQQRPQARSDRSQFHLLSSPTKSVAVSPFPLPHVPELELSSSSMSTTSPDTLLQLSEPEVVTGPEALASTPAKLAKAGWQLFDDPTAAPLEPGDRVKVIEQFDDNGLPFEPRVFKHYVQRRAQANEEIQAELTMPLGLQPEHEEEPAAGAAEATSASPVGSQETSHAAAAAAVSALEAEATLPEPDLSVTMPISNDALARSLASAKSEMEAAAAVKAKADADAAAAAAAAAALAEEKKSMEREVAEKMRIEEEARTAAAAEKAAAAAETATAAAAAVEEEENKAALRKAASAQALLALRAAAKVKAMQADASAKAAAADAADASTADADADADAAAAEEKATAEAQSVETQNDAQGAAETDAATGAKSATNARADSAAEVSAGEDATVTPPKLSLPPAATASSATSSTADDLNALLSTSPVASPRLLAAAASSPVSTGVIASPSASPAAGAAREPGSPKPFMLRHPSLRRAPTVPRADGAAAAESNSAAAAVAGSVSSPSLPPEIPESSSSAPSDDDDDHWRFVVVDGVRQLRVDDQGNPLVHLVAHGRRATRGGDSGEGVSSVLVREGSAIRSLGPDYKGPAATHIDAEIIGSLAGVGVRTVTDKPQTERRQQQPPPHPSPPQHPRSPLPVPKVISVNTASPRVPSLVRHSPVSHGRRAVAPGGAASSSSSLFVGAGSDDTTRSSPLPPRAFGSSSRRA